MTPPDKQSIPRQLSLFRQLLGNSSADLSNMLVFWDAVPKYAINLRQQSRRRDKNGKLPTITLPFTYRDAACEVEITPAYITGPTGEDIAYYPACTEELIEEVLRKFLLESTLGRFDADPVTGIQVRVDFTLKMIQRELRRTGHTRSIPEIKHSLAVLRRVNLRIKQGRNRSHDDSILSSLTMVSQTDLQTDANVMCVAHFARPITEAIQSLAFRQIDYGRMMKHSNQLARWLFRRLSYCYRNASLHNTHRITFDDIERDSGLLHNAARRDRVRATRIALDQLVSTDTLTQWKEEPGHQFVLHPHIAFVTRMKAANKRQQLLT